MGTMAPSARFMAQAGNIPVAGMAGMGEVLARASRAARCSGRTAARMRQGQILELQSIRGLAATVVMIGHALEYYTISGLVRSVTHVLFNGHAAVIVFFVLSGFVLTNSLRRADLTVKSVMPFYIKRFFRIYPAIWAASALGLFYILFMHYDGAPTNHSVWFDHFYSRERLGFIYIAASLAGALAFILPPLWSIFVEIIASGVMPFIAWLAYHKKKLFLAALAASLVVSVTVGALTYYWVAVYIVYFFAGAAICAFPDTFTRAWNATGRLRMATFIAAVVGLLATRGFFPAIYPTPWLYLIDGLCATLIVSGIACGGVNAPVLSRKSLVWLGDISFSVYLVHFPVMSIIGKAMGHADAAWGLSLGPLSSSLVLTTLTIAVTLPLSWFLYVWVEKNGIRVGAMVAERWRKLTTPSVVTG